MPSPLTRHTVQVLGAGVYPLHLLIPAVGLGIAAALALVTRYTVYGKALLAVVQSPQAARHTLRSSLAALVGIGVEGNINIARAIAQLLKLGCVGMIA